MQILDEGSLNSNFEERRAKSSLGENSATRLRTKVVGAQKIQGSQQLMMQQLRGNSSSAMARLHPGSANNT